MRSASEVIAALILIAVAAAASLAVYSVVAGYGERSEMAPSFSITYAGAQALPGGGLYVSVEVTNTGAVPLAVQAVYVVLNGRQLQVQLSGGTAVVAAGASATFSGLTPQGTGARAGLSCEVIVKAIARGGTYAAGETVYVT